MTIKDILWITEPHGSQQLRGNMDVRKRKYRCSLCKKTILRVSDKQWIKSMCGNAKYKTGRLILIKKNK